MYAMFAWSPDLDGVGLECRVLFTYHLAGVKDVWVLVICNWNTELSRLYWNVASLG